MMLRTGCRLLFSVLCLGPAAAAWAEPDESPVQWSSEVGVAYETQTSPLLRLSPQGELISIDGLERLGGANLQASLQGLAGWQWGGVWGASLALDMNQKRSPRTPDFDFGMGSVQPSIHRIFAAGTLDWGLNAQRLDVAGRPFREVRGTQLAWTRASADGNHQTLMADLNVNRHPEGLADLDSTAASVTLQQHLQKPLTGLDGMDLSFIVAGERNERDVVELSHRSAMVTANVQWSWKGLVWAAGASFQHIQFEGQALDTALLRVDRAVGWELAAEIDLSPRNSLRLGYSEVRNVSTLSLYDNTFQSLAVRLRTTWR
ncbi:MAG: hypothetical protein CFE44_01865 [Burkholderiales bacterium PBB4]|nr:MAG: hypothetical protein CFE44_01865 [Burkholderiales bacterium PBB4]